MSEENGICAVLLSPYDGAPQGKAVFCRLLRGWHAGKRRQAGREKTVENGRELTYVYRLTKRDLRWEKRCGSLMLEEAAPEPYGWSIVSRNPEGEVVSKTRLGFSYEWLQTAYYDAGDTSRAAVCLRPAGRGLELLRWDNRRGAYGFERLERCELPEGGLASLLDAEAGEPPVLAELVSGRVGFAPKALCEARAAVLAREADRPFAAGLTDAPADDDALDGFSVIDNASPNAEKPSRREEARPKTPAPAPDGTGDYAADHELSDFPEELVIDLAPRPVERILVDQAANAKAVGALLEEVSAAGRGSGRPARYSVAARCQQGNRPRSAPRDSAEEKPGEAIVLPSLRAVKQIVVSAGESYLYFGKLEDGKRAGRGRTQMENGCTAYEGDYKDDRRDGFGVYYYKSGKLCYAGQWKQNRRDGAGVAFSSRDGSLFAGKWKDDVPTGLGAAFDPEGNLIYTGEWKDGKRHGHGTEYRNGEILFTGEWENGRPVKGFKRVD